MATAADPHPSAGWGATIIDHYGARTSFGVLGYHWARMIEMLHAVEVIGSLLDDEMLLGGPLVAAGAAGCGDRSDRGAARDPDSPLSGL